MRYQDLDNFKGHVKNWKEDILKHNEKNVFFISHISFSFSFLFIATHQMLTFNQKSILIVFYMMIINCNVVGKIKLYKQFHQRIALVKNQKTNKQKAKIKNKHK